MARLDRFNKPKPKSNKIWMILLGISILSNIILTVLLTNRH